MTQQPFVVNTKTTVMKHLAAAKRELAAAPDQGKWRADLRLKVAHLESALKNWIDGKSEYSFIIQC
jgi:hypothetical protein